MELIDILKTLPDNQTIKDNMAKAYAHINDPMYEKIFCGISGGSDSDIILDICYKCDKDKKITYGFFDTGLEYQATKKHLTFLEEKYNITIERFTPKKPVPVSCKTYGEPVFSKYVSDMIYRLQAHDFKWENDTYDNLIQKYPNCQSALKWWCNAYEGDSHFNIRRYKFLKEFMLKHPIDFPVSNKCCTYAKKNVAHEILKNGNYDLNITGIRKAEGGIRGTAYKSCFDEKSDGADDYRPIFWYTNQDKEEYELSQGIVHSECYTKYGLTRTGCFGCVYGRDFEKELSLILEYEPKLYLAANNIFKNSYAYMREYKIFCEEMDAIHGSYQKYLQARGEPCKAMRDKQKREVKSS